jgi:hypothetical protein
MPDTLQANDEIGSRQFSVFMQALYRLHADWSLQAGLSYNRFSYRFIRLNRIPASSSYRLFPPQLVPRLSLVRQFDKRFSVFIAVSKGYSPPTIDEVVPSTGQFNASLLAETALNTEAGLRMNLLGGTLQGELRCRRGRLFSERRRYPAAWIGTGHAVCFSFAQRQLAHAGRSADGTYPATGPVHRIQTGCG